MHIPFAASAVVYAKDISSVSAFYAGTAGLNVAHTEPGYVVLEPPGFQLIVVAICADIAVSIDIASRPQRREDTAIKLVLPGPEPRLASNWVAPSRFAPR